jgi:hypothetical protein
MCDWGHLVHVRVGRYAAFLKREGRGTARYIGIIQVMYHWWPGYHSNLSSSIRVRHIRLRASIGNINIGEGGGGQHGSNKTYYHTLSWILEYH